ncbi:HmuY family protein [Chitinophaga horti]|uniref:HmuY family protein n=1 Tax=Chitinophaga horti TaxID=2920382 RepID=A0ABY6J5Z2_9BACT|nr:HmuY family protein [Chitinophaga horti]UYQ95104.1 HmuY family protein [Chitinophaga horti]
MIPKLRVPILFYLFVAVLPVLMASCGKNGDATPNPEDTTTVNHGNFYKLLRVENFKGDTTDSNRLEPKATLFYSLEQHKSIEDKYVRTSTWDLAMGGLYQSFLSGNNGKDTKNHGAGAPSQGGIIIFQKKFEDVVDIPADAEFKTGKDVYGTDDAGEFGQGIGWYLYDFTGNTVGNGTRDKQHVAYALADSLKLASGQKMAPRTLVVKTAKGNYAKLRMISCYKDAFTPDKWLRDVPHMYFTFEYVMVPAGSKKFEIK